MSARPSNIRLWMALRRQPSPAIVPFLIDAFDRCDPTRSHEAKPSTRLREARHARRMFRAMFRVLLIGIALTALLFNLT